MKDFLLDLLGLHKARRNPILRRMEDPQNKRAPLSPNLAVAGLVFFALVTVYGTVFLAIPEEGYGLDDYLESLALAVGVSPMAWVLFFLPLGILARRDRRFVKGRFCISLAVIVGCLLSALWYWSWYCINGPITSDYGSAIRYLFCGPVCVGATGAFVSFAEASRHPLPYRRIASTILAAIVGTIFTTLLYLPVAWFHFPSLAADSGAVLLFEVGLTAACVLSFIWFLILFPVGLFLAPGSEAYDYRLSLPIGFVAGGLFSLLLAWANPQADILGPWLYIQVFHFPIFGGFAGAACAAVLSYHEFTHRSERPAVPIPSL